MKLFSNEVVISSHPVQIEPNGKVLRVTLVTSFGRMFSLHPDSGCSYLLNDDLAS